MHHAWHPLPPPNPPRNKFRVRDLTTGSVLLRQAATCCLAVKAEGGRKPCVAKPGMSYKRHSRSRRLATAMGYTTAIPPGQLEIIVEEPKEDSSESEYSEEEDGPEEQRMEPEEQLLVSEKTAAGAGVARGRRPGTPDVRAESTSGH